MTHAKEEKESDKKGKIKKKINRTSEVKLNEDNYQQ